MKREEDWLREACAQLAQEETAQLEQNLTRAELLKAEETYRRHRRKALALIRRNTRKQSPARIVLRAAAVLLVLAGAVYLSLRQSPPDTVPQTHLTAATAAPYYSPTPSPNPTTFLEGSPTLSTNPVEISTAVPTEQPTSWPSPTVIPTLASTAEPTPTPEPTATPSPEPTPTPLPTPAPSAVPSPPEGWTGNYFPMGLLDADKPDILWGDGWQQAAWDGWAFTEYTDDRMLDVPEGAEISYVQWEDTVALRAETADGVTLIWVQHDHSLRLFSKDGDTLEMAKSVKKFFEE